MRSLGVGRSRILRVARVPQARDGARPGWDNVVLDEMRRGIAQSLREFWDAGIRGPDFVWAATGPALEAYSKHPVVKKANDPGQTMSVSEFLRAVRRLVVEFVVGRVLGELTRTTAASVSDAPLEGVAGLDDVTTYYLLHRHDFGMNDAPAGACILYALSCNLSEGDLANRYGILLRTGGVVADEDGEPEEGDADAEGEVNEGSGSTFKLRPWKQRRRAGFGAAPANGVSAVPIVDMVHHLMHLWVDGDVHKVNAYIDERGLRRSDTFQPRAAGAHRARRRRQRRTLRPRANLESSPGQRPSARDASRRGPWRTSIERTGVAMSKPSWTPWHQVVRLRDDLRTGELALNEFAADLYDVALQSGKRRIYEDPKEFFALTYPTSALLDLARDVVRRLAGKNQKAVRQLELTYGGGKTHTLITLFHLVNDPASLPDVPAVHEFKARIDVPLPATRVAVLPFDKFDVEKGIEVRDPSGNRRMLRQPWSALAWQLAGADGLRLLHPDDLPEERRTAPAENLLVPMLEAPQKEGRSTLLLLDEVLMFAHGAVDADPAWRERLKNFFQALTQAATKVDRCAIVASLLATDVAKNDSLGRDIIDDLYAIFRREREEGVEPVGKKDVAEVLRRRFFTPDSLKNKDGFRKPVIDALNGIEVLDDETKKSRKDAEERFLASYPFHPDLTEVLYAKWTQLQGFQRTRGVLRTFALALREAEKWDTSPLVGPNVFLSAPGDAGISEAARELTQIATVESHEGKAQEWGSILTGELDKARRIQEELGDLQHREVEQAVFATFLHSQPPGARAQLRELLILVGATRPDKITLQKALREWFDRSWFLDEAADADTKAANGMKPPPPVWRLGSRPNLKQMHADAITRISDAAVEERLLKEIDGYKPLTATASQAGARPHKLPEKPSMVDDDGQFRYVVLGPTAASESGKPSAEARRFIEETTAAGSPEDRAKRHRPCSAVKRRRLWSTRGGARVPRLAGGRRHPEEGRPRPGPRSSAESRRLHLCVIQTNRRRHPAGVLHRRHRLGGQRGAGVQDSGV